MPFSTVVSRKVLDHLDLKTAYTPAAVFLALTTVAVVVGDTGATITEPSYTGYARKAIIATDWVAAAGSAPANVTTNTVETFAACTAGTSTVIGWALVTTVSGAGDILQYGTATSTVISTTQTPATIASGGIVWNLT